MQRLERSQVRVPSPVYIFSDCCGIVWLKLIYIPEIIQSWEFYVFYRILVYVTSASAGYNLLLLCKHSIWSRKNFKGSYLCMAWICFLLDQVNYYFLIIYYVYVCIKTLSYVHTLIKISSQPATGEGNTLLKQIQNLQRVMLFIQGKV